LEKLRQVSAAAMPPVISLALGRKGMAGQFPPAGPVLLEFLGDCQACFGDERFELRETRPHTVEFNLALMLPLRTLGRQKLACLLRRNSPAFIYQRHTAYT